ncbi:CDP-alcohol phosphatidyltransferase family protein [Methanogenium marinum]|uniref:CDP-alcohol phosphatidyltransferase family protein n=1 Tax=Methanogenium marinum TaxID=348610 RepID=A0A9Q4KST8_9EURY|nr:CDP-alcohol phosphatidyltransferase family protein [Methanogenium marinum]MDE4908029.1 CDP-alcohol phosphatidyltransferase family protein [Methanogenium marinum]
MTVDNLRPRVQWIVEPVAKGMAKVGFTPNVCSVIALVVAVAGGAAFYFEAALLAVICIILNAFFDGVDGAIARVTGTAGLKGDFLDHVIDRYADIFIITGIFAGPLASPFIGVFALTGVLMSSYLGTQAQAVGVGRVYGGILGRADRLLLLIVFGIAAAFISGAVYAGITVMDVMLLIFGVLGHITALQRFHGTWKQL